MTAGQKEPMGKRLTYRHHCNEHDPWEDHEQYSCCPRCGEPDLEEISEEEWEALLNQPEPADAPPDDVIEEEINS